MAGLATLAVVLSACTGATTTATDGTSSAVTPLPGGTSGFSDERTGGIDVPVDESLLVSGGPPPDGIPPIDEPTFEDPETVDWLEPNEPVLAVEVDGVAKAYPIRIMTWHEIVNDSFGETPVTVTYCPLCNTGIAFVRPVVRGELLDFGTSGMLFNSNLVMYDRQTETYWAQATGQAILGELVPRRLAFVPARLLSWGDWLQANADGQVLSIETGFPRDYGRNPYSGYDSGEPFLYDGEPDERLPSTAHVLGISSGGETIAIPLDRLAASSSDGLAAVHLPVGGIDHAVFWRAGTSSALDAGEIAGGRDVGAAVAYLPRVDGKRLRFSVEDGAIVDDRTGSRWDITGRAIDGSLEGSQLEVAVAIPSFWFDWAAFHPQTGVWAG
jgi:hypothetical protein